MSFPDPARRDFASDLYVLRCSKGAIHYLWDTTLEPAKSRLNIIWPVKRAQYGHQKAGIEENLNGQWGNKMMRQVCNRQGHLVNPLRMILLFAAMLLFIFTVVFRMVESDSFSTAMAALIESILIVAFFIFLGLFIAYLLYFIHDVIRQRARSNQIYSMFDDLSAKDKSACKPDHTEVERNLDEKAESRPNP